MIIEMMRSIHDFLPVTVVFFLGPLEFLQGAPEFFPLAPSRALFFDAACTFCANRGNQVYTNISTHGTTSHFVIIYL